MNQGFLEKWPISESGQGLDNISLEDLVTWESKKALTDYQARVNTWPYHLDPYSSLTRKEDSESPVSQPKSSKRKSQCFFPGGWLLGLPGSCVLTQGGKDMAHLLLPPRALHHEHCSIPGHLGWPGHLLFSVWQPEMIKKCVFIRHCCKFVWYIFLYKCTLKHDTTNNLIN